MDQYSNCADLAKTNCHTYGEKCEKVRLKHFRRYIYNMYPRVQSCGLCAGMTPHVSNTCWDNWSNCGSLAATHCYQSQISSNCCLSCGLGNTVTMTTHVTPHTAHPCCRSRHDPRGQQHLLRHLLQLRLAVRLLLRQPLQEGVWPLLSGARLET